MGTMRDAVRTREKIIDAARQEFAEHGLAGSRVERVAKRARLSKQLLFHYFSSKQRLYDVVLEDTFRRREAWNLAPTAPKNVLRDRFVFAVNDRLWLRFLMWEAATYKANRAIRWQERRRVAIKRQCAAFRRFQKRYDFVGEADPKHLQLALYSLANHPLLCPQVTKLVTGQEADSQEFQREWSAFLEALAEALLKSRFTVKRATVT
jgi:TetR/AcrR family transcriptional regulator